MELSSGKTFRDAMLAEAPAKCAYFQRWTYDTPLAIRLETNAKLRHIQKLMYQCIRFFVGNYPRLKHMMPVSPEVEAVLSVFQEKPYRTGTYRTDFVVDRQNQIKLIEITCRFALNGFFVTGYFNLMADRYLKSHPGIEKMDEYTPFFDHFADYFGYFDHICLLEGKSDRNETKTMIPIFEKAGYPVHILYPKDIAANVGLFQNAAVISELAHDEICALPADVLRAIMQSNLLNDYRTALLIHDKRFFSVLTKDEFLFEALSAEEAGVLKEYLLPTYRFNDREDIWQAARSDKDQWIIKPSVLGKSADVYAGCMTSAQEWQALFDSEKRKDMVLQEYVPQRMFRGQIMDHSHQDYVAGTLLFFDDNFFGPGLFRASSYPVTNKTDDRKIAFVVTNDLDRFQPDNIL